MSGVETSFPELAPGYKGLLLLGPTGSGKTPLGQLMAQQGIWGRRCVHFDFGDLLRRIAFGESPEAPYPASCFFSPGSSRGAPDPADSETLSAPAIQRPTPFGSEYFTHQEREFIRQVLQTGALLEDEHFRLAIKILKYFLVLEGLESPQVLRQPADQPLQHRTACGLEPLIVLNGLPRHVGQAEALNAWVEVQAVVHLDCPPEVVLERIRSNVGKDRQGRTDDDVASVQAKLATYQARTQPLIDYYCNRGVPILRLPVTASQTPTDAWCLLEKQNPWQPPAPSTGE